MPDANNVQVKDQPTRILQGENSGPGISGPGDPNMEVRSHDLILITKGTNEVQKLKHHLYHHMFPEKNHCDHQIIREGLNRGIYHRRVITMREGASTRGTGKLSDP